MEFLIPEQLETDRLVLRMFRPDDWQDLYGYYADKVCTRYTIGRVLTPAETWGEMAARAGHWLLRGYGPYAVEERSCRRVVGMVGPWYPEEWPEPEITWHLVRAYFGRGYASEAARAVLAMVRTYLPEIPWISVIHPDNIGSVNLAHALGARFEKTIRFRNGEWHQYRHQ